MVIQIPTDPRKFFRQFLEIIKVIPPLDVLRGRELDVLAELLYYNNEYSEVKEDLRGRLIFDYKTRLSIREYLGITEYSLNDILSSLRKKNIINKKSLKSDYGLDISKPLITFKFNITANGKGN